ncbi:MAG: preprotein translocase subunit SecY [Candidatus Kaiserbacteria bacterium]|nr:preprotein translocase subunit SecY [Candidatus Kaiserbacteria bacterium]
MSTKAFKACLTDTVLLKRFLAVIVGLLVFRLLTSIPIPQISEAALTSLLYQNQILGVFNLFSGGGLSNFSIAMLGVFPYITVSIVVQLLTSVSPRLHSLYHEEGDVGRRKIGQWSRIATVPVAALNAGGILLYFQSQGVIPSMPIPDMAMTILLIVTGCMLSMWIGELMTEFGIGNGISMIIFAGIVVNIPTLITQVTATYSPDLLLSYALGFIGIVIGCMVAVWMNEADRPVPITYARYGIGHGAHDRRVETYVPVKVNPAGVLPVIFSITVAMFFQYIFRYLSEANVAVLQPIGLFVTEQLAQGYPYALVVALATVFFTYFHTPIIFNTKKISDNLQKQGAFIPGVRPGEETESYFGTVLVRIIFYAAIFLAAIAALPFVITGSTAGTFIFAIGGTGALIVVHVVLDVYRKITARVRDTLEMA